MTLLRLLVFLVLLLLPVRTFAAPRDLPSLYFVCAAASEAAYAGELPELLRARLVAAGWQIESYETEGHRGTVGRFFHMVRTDEDGAETHLVAFPGTERGSDVWTDLRLGRVPFGGSSPAEFLALRDAPVTERSETPLVHRGFLDYTQAALFTDVLPAYGNRTAGEVLAAELRAHPSMRVYLTGHSLGGAAAVLTAARLADMGVSPTQLVVTTFGAPAVGNAAFARRYEGRFNLHRVVMRGDPMKDVLAAPLGFRHFGERVAWSPAWSAAKFPHAMIVYVDAAIRQLYDAYGGDNAFLFLMGQPKRTEGRTLYVTPIETELDDTLTEDAPYMMAVLRDALHVQNAAAVFAAGEGGLSAEGLLSGLDGHLSAAREVGAEEMVAYRITGVRERTARETYRLTLERAIYDMDGNLIAATSRSARTGTLTPIETVLYLFAQD
ncbi:triacylglycerol lipase [Selenomonas sp. oral taxon 920]|uniref:lipase family protein n=1 Tax=Selenomonas sp. oral taxon 920 TaxID=1884263 RepID=UPI000840F5BC|nr:lipase family protein [Selenomonas sp. oral taxon 920]AOH48896.1 triacylglycerol lipase [Selenomonas sp. oral taxon 920]